MCPDGVIMDNSKVNAVINWLNPSNVKDLQCLLVFTLLKGKALQPSMEQQG